MKELEFTKLSYYKFTKERLENKLTSMLNSKYLRDDQKEKFRIMYNKKIDEYDFKIKKEEMKQR